VKQSFKGWDASVLAHQSIIAENKARIYRSISSPKVETTPEGARRNEADLQASGNNLSAALLRKILRHQHRSAVLYWAPTQRWPQH